MARHHALEQGFRFLVWLAASAGLYVIIMFAMMVGWLLGGPWNPLPWLAVLLICAAGGYAILRYAEARS